jgi:hypothetical protein
MTADDNRGGFEFKYQLGELTLFKTSVPLHMRRWRLADEDTPEPDAIIREPLADEFEGFILRNVPLAEELPLIATVGDYLRYAVFQYQHCYIDLRQTYDEYLSQFSSKTRSTLRRKVKKYREFSGGEIRWASYATPEDMPEFYRHARTVSALTYQEKLLDVGIPDSDQFAQQLEADAAADRVRGYILFHDDKPVSYLYCPIEESALVYAHLGYDPEYARHSVGTVLQSLVIEQLCTEGRFHYFDFTEGQSAHKRLFATHQVRRANILYLTNTLKHRVLVRTHDWTNRLSGALGDTLERIGLKKKIKDFLRRR